MSYKILIFLVLLASCQVDKPHEKKVVVQKEKPTTTVLKDTVSNITTSTDTILEKKESIPQKKFSFKNIRFPILMVEAKGCGGAIIYKYAIPQYETRIPYIEIFTEYPNCPPLDNAKPEYGTFYSRIPKRFSYCKRKYIIEKMREIKPDYLNDYNRYFKTNLTTDRPEVSVVSPEIAKYKGGMGESTQIFFDTINGLVKTNHRMHNHSITFDVNSCGWGWYIGEIPKSLPDSIKTIIKEKAIKHIGGYVKLYENKYGKF